MLDISIKAEKIFLLGSFPVTNALLLSIGTLAILVTGSVVLHRKLAIIPGAFQNFLEMILDGALKLMESVLGDRETSEKYLPLIATIFFFVLVSNLLGLLPIVGSIGIHTLHEGKEAFIPIFRSPASDLNFTIILAIIAVTSINALGFAALGFKRYAGRFFNFRNPIQGFAGILELISEFVKIVSFSFRLFGNIFAGEVLLTVIGFLVPYLIPLPFLFLEFFVAFIQAFIFAMLTLVFVGIAVSHHETTH
ncbi:F0F1 ATP synthase subunit A [Candidatus Jorgensenbacteria bacterium]|nr:F0F1 ATP synthase subunit A [Candidatus Jorgensenbacteria bacterium]